MNLKLPDDVAEATAPLFAELPLDRAMTQLVVTRPAPRPLVDRVASLVRQPAVARRPALVAGLWLYVDELDRSHNVSQSINDDTGSFWHGIMHRREGDFGNSHYWFRRTGDHPAMKAIDHYDAHRFIDEVAAAHRGGDDEALIAMQRHEWRALFEWCAK